MGASSVTGTGHGVGIGSKGPQNLRNQFVTLESPRILECDVVTVGGGGVAEIDIVPVPGNENTVFVFANSVDNGSPVGITRYFDERGLYRINLQAPANYACFYMIVTKGIASQIR